MPFSLLKALAACALVAWAAPLVPGAAHAQPLQPIPELRARVTDLTGTLSPSQRSALEQKLEAFERRKGAQVAVLIVATTQPEEIEQYAIRVAEAWKLGRGASDDGALLLVAKEDRRSASRSATASKARSRTRSRTASSTRRSCPAFEPATSPAASTRASSGCSR
jgi:uncharacterized membrane protein YgcG